MTNILAEICDKKRDHVQAQKNIQALADIKEKIKDTPAPLGFKAALETGKFPAIICEIKKASPSKGIIRDDFAPIDIANTYKDNGAACLSVLTDTPYFQGSDQIFTSVREISPLPMLRKDFMIDPYQIFESRALGADCILIIMAALSDDAAKQLYETAKDLGMDALIEVHNEQELERAINSFSPDFIGVNNRNLKTLKVDIQTSIDIAKQLPNNVHKVAESGLQDFSTLSTLKDHGYKSFLIGESLMKQPDIGKALQEIRGTA